MKPLYSWLLGSLLIGHACGVAALDSVIAPRADKSLALDIVATGPEQHVAVGERGHVLVSSDDGQSWQQVQVPTRATLTSIAASNGQIIVGGHDGVLLLSNDGGQVWKMVRNEPEQEKPVLDIVFLDQKTAFAVGAYGLYLKTTDGGYRWVEEEHPELEIPEFGFPHFYQLLPLQDGSLLLVGEAGFVARSEDNGDSWTTLPLPYEGSLFAVGQTESGALIVAGMRGNILRSDDLGQNWQTIDIDIRSGLNNIVVDGKEVVITGMDGIILRSIDDGRTFTVKQRPNRKAIAAATLEQEKLLVAAEDGLHVLELPATAQ
ncbi:WD40/YVTN/BNR-like repeat-containing protein [Permianibacter aggregans]|uniref:Photosystem II stability/assembly factor-like uncharacterized protein n=1 Tax=Permianibacter aggregans TaxID=1510150 RepID=A0A4R6UAF5_9GAMM|nr:YCF48-related protein [Permianibacter aggregans]QGX40953.1 hypothetical protein E2H98_15290 [Permianibacter aggregans]TDQ43610.1 photosystem II stability/assembly factor-like uncharacterized protein [Permianibacter aggregans]